MNTRVNTWWRHYHEARKPQGALAAAGSDGRGRSAKRAAAMSVVGGGDVGGGGGGEGKNWNKGGRASSVRVPYTPNALAGVWTVGGWDTVFHDDDDDDDFDGHYSSSSFQPRIGPRA